MGSWGLVPLWLPVGSCRMHLWIVSREAEEQAFTHCLQLCVDQGLPHRKSIIQIYVCIGTNPVPIGIWCRGSEKSEGRKQEKWVQLRQGADTFYLSKADMAAMDGVKDLKCSSRATWYKYHLKNLLKQRWEFWKQSEGSNSIKRLLACVGQGCRAHKILSNIWKKTYFNWTIPLIINSSSGVNSPLLIISLFF